MTEKVRLLPLPPPPRFFPSHALPFSLLPTPNRGRSDRHSIGVATFKAPQPRGEVRKRRRRRRERKTSVEGGGGRPPSLLHRTSVSSSLLPSVLGSAQQGRERERRSFPSSSSCVETRKKGRRRTQPKSASSPLCECVCAHSTNPSLPPFYNKYPRW